MTQKLCKGGIPVVGTKLQWGFKSFEASNTASLDG